MSKQEEIRESIEQHVGLCLKATNGIPSTTFANSISKSLVQLLDEQDVVIKRDRELPIIGTYLYEHEKSGYKDAQRDMKEAGYEAVIPLIKEK